MKETVDAVYENGVLRPLRKLSMHEGQRIRIIVEKTTSVEPAQTDNEELLWLKSVSKNPAFAFLAEAEEDIYGLDDGVPLDD